MIARKIILLRGNDTALGVSPTTTVLLPNQGFWRIVAVAALYNAAAAAAPPSVGFDVLDGQGVLYAAGVIPCGVAAFDRAVAWQKDGPVHVPTVDTQVAQAPCPTQVLDCGRSLRLVLTGNSGADVSQLSSIVVTLEQMASDDGAKL